MSAGDAEGRAVGRRARRPDAPLEHVPIGGASPEGTRQDRDVASPGEGPASSGRLPQEPPERDPLGKMALFSSGGKPDPPMGSLLLECSSCRRETPVSPVELVKAGLPISLHLFLIRRYPSLMRCPACGRRTWLRIRWRL